ncbi:MAG: ClbS/DfsB family four-helix bundle protein [Longimicrobiales bacterium]
MPIPTSRAELVEQLSAAYAKLRHDLASAGPEIATVECVDDWTVKDVLAVRSWWTHAVTGWIEAGREGRELALPAEGYRWNETPRLNRDIVADASSESYESVLRRLDQGFERAMACVAALDDGELLDSAVFAWAGKWPVSRWVSINTTRQYVTARKYVRRAIRASGGSEFPGAAS